ncbi:MAG: hypothetical protein WC614_01300 [bacterium]
MKFNFTDILRAPRIGFSAKKIWVATLGLLIGTVLYSILTYCAYLTCFDWNWISIWQTYKLIPLPIIGETSFAWYNWALWILGLALFVGVNFISIGAISKLTIEQLRGDEFYEITDAVKYSMKQWKAVMLSPLVLMIFIASLLVVGFVCGLIGRIPYAGQLFAGMFFIPVAFGSIFIVYLGIVLLVSLIIGPSIAGSSESDVFDTLFEVFSCLNDQTWRLILWEILVGLFAIIGTLVLGWIVKQGLVLMEWGCGLWAGPRGWWDIIWTRGICYLPAIPTIDWIEKVVSRVAPVLIIAPPTWSVGNWAEIVGGFLVGISFYFILFFVMAYGVSIWSAGQTLIYTVLVKMKDEKNLLEKIEEEFEEEKIEEETTEKKIEEHKEEEKHDKDKEKEKKH